MCLLSLLYSRSFFFYFFPFFFIKVCLDCLKPFLVNIFIYLTFKIVFIIFLFVFVYFKYNLYFRNFFTKNPLHHSTVICALLNNNIILLLLFFFTL